MASHFCSEDKLYDYITCVFLLLDISFIKEMDWTREDTKSQCNVIFEINFNIPYIVKLIQNKLHIRSVATGSKARITSISLRVC